MNILFFTEQWVNGGVTSFIMNILRNMDPIDDIFIDVCVSEDMTDIYDDELKTLGVYKYVLTGKERLNPLLRLRRSASELKRLLSKRKYDIVHFHLCNTLGIYYAKIARSHGCKTIVHSHNSGSNSKFKNVVNYLLKYLFRNVPDRRFACSDFAAKWLFLDKYFRTGEVEIIKNGIDLNRFVFDEAKRKKTRAEIGVKDEIVICHIGRYIRQKNHDFLIDIYNVIYSKCGSNAKLLLIGEGPFESQIWEKAKMFGLCNSIIRISNTHDIPNYLCAADVFVLTSFFEGFPVVGIEAQANGLPCVFSDEITSQVKLLPSTVFLS